MPVLLAVALLQSDELIQQLNAEEPGVRDEAEARLQRLAQSNEGKFVESLLKARSDMKSPEVKARIERILRRVQWNRLLWIHAVEGGASPESTPIVTDELCVFLTADQALVYARADGKLLFTTTTRGRPAIYRDMLIANVPSGDEIGLQALDAKTGKRVWYHGISDLKKGNEPQGSDLLIFKDRLVAGTPFGQVVCLEAASGKRLWAVEPPREKMATSNRNPSDPLRVPIFKEGEHPDFYLPIALTDARQPYFWIHARKGGSGYFDLDGKFSNWMGADRIMPGTRPVIEGAKFYYVRDVKPTWCVMRELGIGKVRGHWPVPVAGTVSALCPTESTIVIQTRTELVCFSQIDANALWTVANEGPGLFAKDDQGRLYAASKSGDVLVLDLEKGSLARKIDLRAILKSEEASVTQLHIVGRTLYVGTRTHVAAVEIRPLD